jgi:hypothetical protein
VADHAELVDRARARAVPSTAPAALTVQALQAPPVRMSGGGGMVAVPQFSATAAGYAALGSGPARVHGAAVLCPELLALFEAPVDAVTAAKQRAAGGARVTPGSPEANNTTGVSDYWGAVT